MVLDCVAVTERFYANPDSTFNIDVDTDPRWESEFDLVSKTLKLNKITPIFFSSSNDVCP